MLTGLYTDVTFVYFSEKSDELGIWMVNKVSMTEHMYRFSFVEAQRVCFVSLLRFYVMLIFLYLELVIQLKIWIYKFLF